MRTQWTPEKFREELSAVCSGLGYFPTNNELISLKRYDLANQITRRGGFVKVAEMLGFARERTDYDTGKDGEREVLGLLLERFQVATTTCLAPYDLLVEDVLRIDVKAANYAEYGACRGWFYRVGKHAQADVLAFYQLDTKDCYFIPWYMCPATNVTIARGGGKYAAFRNNVDALQVLVEARTSEQVIFEEAKVYPCRNRPSN